MGFRSSSDKDFVKGMIAGGILSKVFSSKSSGTESRREEPPEEVHTTTYTKTLFSPTDIMDRLEADSLYKEITYEDIVIDYTSANSVISGVKEAGKAMGKVTDSNVFFAFYDYIFYCCKILYPYEDAGLTHDTTVEKQAEMFYEQIPGMVNAFIQRGYDEKCESLKNTDEDERRLKSESFFNKLIEDMESYGNSYLTKENAEKLEELIKLELGEEHKVRIPSWQTEPSRSLIPRRAEYEKLLEERREQKEKAKRGNVAISILATLLNGWFLILLAIIFWIARAYKLLAITVGIMVIVCLIVIYVVNSIEDQSE